MAETGRALGREQTGGRSATLLQCLVIVGRRHGLNLTISQIVQDNSLPDAVVSSEELLLCAERAGLKAKLAKLAWRDLSQLKKALPAIVTLKSGASMVLVAFEEEAEAPYVQLQDPAADESPLLTIDQSRFEEACAGDVILVRRNRDKAEAERPFDLWMIVSRMLRERRLVRDLAISSFVLSLFALAPIVFWIVLSSYVIYYASMNTFAVACTTFAVVVIFEMLFTYLRSFLVHVVTARIDAGLSEYMFDKVIKLPIDFFERNQVGEIGHSMGQMWALREFMTSQLFITILDSMMLFVFLPLMFYLSVQLTFVVLAFCSLILVWLVLMLPLSRKVAVEILKAESERGALLFQTLNGMRTVKSLALETRQRELWDAQVAKTGKLRLRVGNVRAIIQAGVRPLDRLAVSGSFALGVYSIVSATQAATSTTPTVDSSWLFPFVMLSMRVASPLMHIAQLINKYDEARASLVVVGKLVNQPSEEGASDHGVRSPLSGHVEFLNLRFKYQGAINYAIDGVTFEAPIGQTLGIVGRSGSGKTTITRLLQRLHSDYEGLIKIDGVDVREYDVTHLRRSLGVVLQENFLFSGTIRENISSSKPHATFDEVVRAARLAGAEEFIDRLPQGYDTFIYEGSPNLSGGQKQRLAIARALVVDPRILILDEATSALDPDSEAIVNENIRRIAQGRTVIVVSHRLSSLVKSDAILVMERGKVADIGKHDELLERCEIYSGLWSQQNRHIAAAARPVATRGPSRVS